MNEFEAKLNELLKESEELQKKENDLKFQAQAFNEKLMSFFKENGLSDNFTLPQLAALAVRKSKA